MKAAQKDIALLEALYEGRKPYFGELHDHAATGGTSDGKLPLEGWKTALAELEMDFATIVDHKQVRHMYLPEWDAAIFIGGTEPGTKITDDEIENSIIHYNMLFAKPQQLEQLLEAFPEFQFEGGPEGHFGYPGFTRARFTELVDKVTELGGFFVHPHPKSKMKSDNPADYWFRDETGLEVLYTFYQEPGSERCWQNFELWKDLLALGKRVYATAGNDEHNVPKDKALTTIYSPKKHSESYVQQLRKGDFVCGGVGIKMCIGQTTMGGCTAFAGKRLVLSVDKLHKSLLDPEHTYRVELLDDTGVVLQQAFSAGEEIYLAVDADPEKKFYRAEVYDNEKPFPIALGNPIWNT